MEEFVEKYINPFTDFGFKKIFGQEYNKDLLLDFLNTILLRGSDPIKDIKYKPTEQYTFSLEDRKSVFDIFCESESGERFIVEMQKNKQTHFLDRTLYYSTLPIIDQAQKGVEWDYKLSAVYVVAVMDFNLNLDGIHEGCLHHVKIVELESNKVFHDKLTFVYIEMPKFVKKLEELEDNIDKWLYVLKNISKLQELPEKLKNRIFEKLFKVAEIAKYTHEEWMAYQISLKDYRDNRAAIKTAIEEGRQEGIKEERKIQEAKIKQMEDTIQKKDDNLQQLANLLLKNGYTKEQIFKETGIEL
jgi:predicted transposase/invertase (TIGR01784 family)